MRARACVWVGVQSRRGASTGQGGGARGGGVGGGAMLNGSPDQ